MSNFILRTEIYLKLYEDLSKRRNELNSYSYILDKIKNNSYQESAMIRSWIVIINSHYEWCIKNILDIYLKYIYDTNSKVLKDFFYYDSIEKINKWKIVNNIKISKLNELITWLGLSYPDFLKNINSDVLEKKIFLDEVLKNNLKNELYVYENWRINIEATLKKIINNNLIEKRNSVWHWDLLKIDKKLFFILKLFIFLFLNSFIWYIIDNIDKENYLNKTTYSL